MTATKKIAITYSVVYVDGYSSNGHFGREIEARIDHGPQGFSSLERARAALRWTRGAHGGRNPGRFDIVGSDGSRSTWE
jgi:hypothetical protein